MTTRRSLVLGIAAALGVAAAPSALAGPRGRPAARRTRRRVVRRRRRRIRRRVRRRTVAGVSYLVVPVGLVVGWELMVDDRVYVVTGLNTVDGKEVVVLTADDGTTKQEPILREDTPENGEELEGSELPEGDDTTPGVDIPE